jgi:hypothetical protein
LIFKSWNFGQVEYKPEWLEPLVKANFKLRTMDNADLDHDILSLWDQKNYENKLKVRVIIFSRIK